MSIKIQQRLSPKKYDLANFDAEYIKKARNLRKVDFIAPFCVLWYRIVTVASPRVAAQDAADCKPGSADGAMLAKGFYGILAACGCEAA